MKLFDRIALYSIFILAGGILSGQLMAQGGDMYPSKPIKIIVPVSAGGSTDRLAR